MVGMRLDLQLLVDFERSLAGRLQLEQTRGMTALARSSGFVHCGKRGPGSQHSPTAAPRGS